MFRSKTYPLYEIILKRAILVIQPSITTFAERFDDNFIWAERNVHKHSELILRRALCIGSANYNLISYFCAVTLYFRNPQPLTLHDLYAAVREEWQALDHQFIRFFILGVPQRLQIVVRTRKDPSKCLFGNKRCFHELVFHSILIICQQ